MVRGRGVDHVQKVVRDFLLKYLVNIENLAYKKTTLRMSKVKGGPGFFLWLTLGLALSLGIKTVQSFFKNNCLKICVREQKSWFFTLEC